MGASYQSKASSVQAFAPCWNPHTKWSVHLVGKREVVDLPYKSILK